MDESYYKGMTMTSEVSTQEVRVSVSVDERLVKLPKGAFVALVNEFHDRLMGHAIAIEDGPQKLYL
jgi:hypothetical protein